MASDKSFIEPIINRLDPALEPGFRHMFGEFGIFCRGKMVALVCDNHFMVKPTEAGRAFLEEVVMAEPYPGAKPCFLIDKRLDDGPWLSELLGITWDELPFPRKRKPKGKRD